MKKTTLTALLAAALMTGCTDDKDAEYLGPLTPEEDPFGKANDVFTAEEWYPGGQLGTTEKASYSAPAPAVENISGMEQDFNVGEDFFEHLYTVDVAPRKGLGPAWVRNSCIACHPAYGHGKRQTSYRANDIGNGYLLVVYHPNEAFTEDGVRYTVAPSSYISEVTGMPQTQAMKPFKAPIDETQISIEWRNVESMPSGLSMTFPDGSGESYSLIYPVVNIPVTAFNTNPVPTDYEVRLESTIGLYGTGLLDALTDEDIEAQWKAESKYVELNPAMWDKDAGTFKASAYYSAAYNDIGTFRGSHGPLKRFTYAMTRGSLQDGAGANAIWNITNVTRSDRHFLYTTPAWAQAMSEDPEVISYIKEHGREASSILYPYYADGTDAGIAARVYEILSASNFGKRDIFEQYLLNNAPYNGEEEMSDKQYYQFIVWHRGLAVPAARNLDDPQVQRGKQLFTEMGCAQCHRPSWKTGDDNMWVDGATRAYADANQLATDGDYTKLLPKYPNQTIWPYTDMVQHRLFMENDIRTGWCRTTPLWGRGLSHQLTGADDRLHDCRARTVTEAIMWHGYSKQSDGYRATVKFYNLPKADRDAVVKFIESI